MATVVYYSGDVQGVGFRATAVRIARMHPTVRGWVRNLADGSTEAVEAFLADVRSRMADHIASENVVTHDSDVTLTGFRIVG